MATMKNHAAWLNKTVITGNHDPLMSAPRFAMSAAVPKGTATKFAGVETRLKR